MRWSRYTLIITIYQAMLTSRACAVCSAGTCCHKLPAHGHPQIAIARRSLLCITSTCSSSTAKQSLYCDISVTRHHCMKPAAAFKCHWQTNRPCPQLALRCSVDAISFSAHADFPQTSDFLDEVNPPHVVLVHGEAGEMMRLKRALEQRAKATDRIRNLYTPKVTQPVHIRHQPRHVAKVCPYC